MATSSSLSLALVCCLLFVGCCSFVNAASTEQDMFTSLYQGVEAMVVPHYDSNAGAPNQVILFELPGVAINRDEYDVNVWSSQGFSARQPDALAAGFVDRLPFFTGPTFVDSGSTISDVWGHFMYQYIIPIVDDPIQIKRVNDARVALANGTLQAAYQAAADLYQQSFIQFVSFRSDCLAKQPAGVCSYASVLYREDLKRKWFSLEVARRDIAAAESKIIALQVQDLKNIFAESLYTYASNERVDMGGEGFGNSYYLTYLTPSNFWRWWPSTGMFDYNVYADGSVVIISPPVGATIIQSPANGFLNPLANSSYAYRPNAGYTGSDQVGWSVTTLNSIGQNVTTEVFKSIRVIGNDVIAANTAFVAVSTSTQTTSSSSSSFSTSFSTYNGFGAGFGWWGITGASSSSSYSSGFSSASLSTSSTLAFQLAKVVITRPWLDTSVLSFYPVAIRDLSKQGWSDGTLTPAAGALQFKFKLLPTAFLVARNILISTTLSTTQTSAFQDATSSSSSSRIQFGPFFSGATSSSAGSSTRDYHEDSSLSGGTVSLRGPQVIGWLCTPVPPFPTAAESEVRDWEAAQIARQNAAQNATQLLNILPPEN